MYVAKIHRYCARGLRISIDKPQLSDPARPQTLSHCRFRSNCVPASTDAEYLSKATAVALVTVVNESPDHQAQRYCGLSQY